MNYRCRKKISYLLHARHRKGHGIHSPFLFRLITTVIENSGNFSAWPLLKAADENVRNMLKILDMRSFHEEENTGSNLSSCEIKKRHQLPERFDRLLFRLVNEFKPGEIAFFGSTFGVTLLALALADRRISIKAQVENDHYRSFCRRLVDVYELENIHIAESGIVIPVDLMVIQHPMNPGYCDQILSQTLANTDFAGVVVICDIHHSQKMETIWNQHKTSETVRVSLDLFEIGILICGRGLQKEDFVLRF